MKQTFLQSMITAEIKTAMCDGHEFISKWFPPTSKGELPPVSTEWALKDFPDKWVDDNAGSLEWIERDLRADTLREASLALQKEGNFFGADQLKTMELAMSNGRTKLP